MKKQEHKANEEKIINEIKNYFIEHEETFNIALEQLSDWNGYAADDIWYEMDEINELLCGKDAGEILLMSFNGYDVNYTTDTEGVIHYSQFNPNADYFRFNVYGNLESSCYKDYTDYIERDTILEMLENRDEIDSIGDTAELSELFDKLESAAKHEAQHE